MIPKSTKRFHTRGREARLSLCAILAAVVLLPDLFLTGPVHAQAKQDYGTGLTDEEIALASALIREYKYFDTARRFLESLKTRRGAKPMLLAEIASLEIDIKQAEGKDALADLDAFKKKFPWHPRASLGSLEQIGSKLGAALQKVELSKTEPDATKSAKALSDAKKIFTEEVSKPLDALIVSLGETAKASADKKGNQDPQKKRLFYQAEFARVNIFYVYANALPEDDKDREATFEKGLDYASFFVEERYEFFIMQYKAQIQKGLYLSALGRNKRAAEELELMYDVEPPSTRNMPPALIKAFHEIRLQALLFGARAHNAAGAYDNAVYALKPIMRAKLDPKNPLSPAIGAVEDDPDLQKFAVLARLEYGISVAGVGNVSAGMRAIHAVISKYEKLHKETKNETYQAFVIDARKALGRISAAGAASLSGKDYYQAGIGLKSQLKFEEALDSFQKALGALEPLEQAKIAPLCLNEIGEICYMLGRFDESAVAFSEIALYYPGAEIFTTKANRSFIGALTKAVTALGAAGAEHAGFKELEKLASKFGADDTAAQASMVQGQTAEQQSQYERARRAYRKIKIDDPTYGLRAHASSWATFVREYEVAGSNNDKKAQEKIAENFDEGIPALKDILEKARAKNNRSAGSVAALALGQMHYNRDEYPEAVKTLSLFVSEYEDDKNYRCTALGYLVLAAVHAKEGEGAYKYYVPLRKSCKDDPAAAAAAYALSDDATDRGDLKRAALFMRHYARHPTTKDDLKDLQLLIKIVQVLTDGGYVSDARDYIEMAKAVGGSGDLQRVLIWMEMGIAKSAEQWGKVIDLGNKYVEQYRVDGDNYEDPFVCRELGWATLRKARQKRRTGTLPLDACMNAEKFYNHALYLLDGLMKKGTPENPVDSSVRREYWLVALRLMQVKSHLGRNDDPDGYNDIHKFCNENRQRVKKYSSKLWTRFEKLWIEALKALDRDPADFNISV